MGSRENLSALGGAFAPWENDCNLLAYRTSPRVNIFLVKNPLVPSMNIPHAVRICLVFKAFFLSFAVCGQAAFITTPVTSAEFATVFDYGNSRTTTGSDAVWYAQAQASGNPTFNLELGGTGAATDLGSVAWTDGANNPFSVSVDNAGNLDFIFNGQRVGDGLPTVAAYNEVWVGIRLATTDPDDELSINSASTDGPSLFADTSVTGSTNGNPVFAGYKFHFDDRLSNIGEFVYQGNLNPDMFAEPASGEEWTLTVVGVNNSSIPEPSSMLLLLAGGVALLSRRRVRNMLGSEH
jgi:hypothetical protein